MVCSFYTRLIALQKLFGMVNALQIVVFLPLLDVNFPANAAGFFQYLTKIAAFDVLEIGDYVDDLLELPIAEP